MFSIFPKSAKILYSKDGAFTTSIKHISEFKPAAHDTCFTAGLPA